jgi:predicted small lipoprotein YifL
MKNKMISLAVVAVFVGALLGCVVHGPLFGPPPLREEVASAQPRSTSVWISGHWGWRGGQYVWMSGYWFHQRPGRNWVSGHWDKRGRYWKWFPGYWR